jgi:hypothetical protein
MNNQTVIISLCHMRMSNTYHIIGYVILLNRQVISPDNVHISTTHTSTVNKSCWSTLPLVVRSTLMYWIWDIKPHQWRTRVLHARYTSKLSVFGMLSMMFTQNSALSDTNSRKAISFMRCSYYTSCRKVHRARLCMTSSFKHSLDMSHDQAKPLYCTTVLGFFVFDCTKSFHHISL